MASTTTPTDTTRAILDAYAALSDRYTASGLRGYGLPTLTARRAPVAVEAARTVLSPIMEQAGVLGWLVTPTPNERIRAYAQRAARCAAARCAEAGVGVPSAITHDGAETLGRLTGHVAGYDGVAEVSAIERSQAAAILGRKGGLTRTPARREAARKASAASPHSGRPLHTYTVEILSPTGHSLHHAEIVGMPAAKREATDHWKDAATAQITDQSTGVVISATQRVGRGMLWTD